MYNGAQIAPQLAPARSIFSSDVSVRQKSQTQGEDVQSMTTGTTRTTRDKTWSVQLNIITTRHANTIQGRPIEMNSIQYIKYHGETFWADGKSMNNTKYNL